MKTNKDRLIYWVPRILSILFLCFLALFSLDVFDGNYGFWGTLLGLFMHNIPVFVLAIVLAVAWKREIVGTVFFALAGLAYIVSVVVGMRGDFQPFMISWSFIIAGPAFAIAWLFWLGWRKRESVKKS